MASIHENFPGVPAPTPVDPRLAEALLGKSNGGDSPSNDEVIVSIQTVGKPTEVFRLPSKALAVIQEVVSAISQNKLITLIPDDAQLSINQAADFLTVSREKLVALINDGTLPSQKQGPLTTVCIRDVRVVQQQLRLLQEKALDELVALGQEMDLGY